jgi:L-amino acid N-acyltransferase YncA
MNDFVIIKQICIDPKQHHKGYGTLLYSFLMNKVKQNIFAAIVLQPINQVSINFHKKMGFKNVFTVTPEDQIKRAVFFYSNS